MWNKVVRRTTEMTIANDLRPAYYQMCAIVNQYDLNGHLSKYPDLFPTVGSSTEDSNERKNSRDGGRIHSSGS